MGNSPVSGEFPVQRPVTRSFDISFDLRPHKRLSKQWWGWWNDTLSCPLWRHGNECWPLDYMPQLPLLHVHLWLGLHVSNTTKQQQFSNKAAVQRKVTLHWRHNERDGVSNHRRLHGLPNRLFTRRFKENIKAPRPRALWRELTGDWWISLTKGK